ncbi:MAG: hypothetical protein WA952_04535 [Lewinella sp.]
MNTQTTKGIDRLAGIHGYNVAVENDILTIRRVQTKSPGTLLIFGGVTGIIIGILARFFVMRILGTIILSMSAVALASGIKMNKEDQITKDRVLKFKSHRVSVQDEGDRTPRQFEKARIHSFEHRVNRYDSGETVSVVMRLHDGNNITVIQLGRENKASLATDAKRLAALFTAQLEGSYAATA